MSVVSPVDCPWTESQVGVASLGSVGDSNFYVVGSADFFSF